MSSRVATFIARGVRGTVQLFLLVEIWVAWGLIAWAVAGLALVFIDQTKVSVTPDINNKARIRLLAEWLYVTMGCLAATAALGPQWGFTLFLIYCASFVTMLVH